MYSKKLIEIVAIRQTKRVGNLLQVGSELHTLLQKETSFLPKTTNNNQRLYYVEHGLHSQVKCPHCSKPTTLSYKKKTYKILCCTVKCSAQFRGDDGLSKAKRNGMKGSITKAKIDVNSGLSINQMSGSKISKTLNTILPSGLTKAQEIGKKTQKTMLTVNEDGLTLGQVIRRKSNNSRKKRRSDIGMTTNQLTGLKSKQTKHINFFNKLLQDNVSEFTIITTIDEYEHNTEIEYQCRKCNTIRKSIYPYIRCLKCNPKIISDGERDISEYIKKLNIIIEGSNRNEIKPLELDILIKSHNIAIEYDGLFWHSHNKLKDKNYHLNKTELCEAKGIQLLHIFENEWLDPTKQKIWKSIISNKLGQSTRLYARNCEIRTVIASEKCEFLKVNHLQGNCQSSVNVGLYHDDKLVSLMTFGKSRYTKKYDWELLRFCNILNTTVVGGASRLLKRFRTIKSGSIVSYADKRRSDGNLYKQLGFVHSHDSKPNYWYFKNKGAGLESRIKYQKHKLNNVLDKYDVKLTETENMYENGYRKIYDCGNQVWALY